MQLTRIAKRIVEYLYPHLAERDAGFRLEVQRLARRSLYGLSLLCLLGCLTYLVVTELGVIPVPRPAVMMAVAPGLVIALGLFVLGRSPLGLRFGRPVALASMAVMCFLSVRFDLVAATSVVEAERFVLADATGALLVAIVLVPALPAQTLLLGLSLAAAWVLFFPAHFGDVTGHSPIPLALILVTDGIFCAVLSAVSYHRLWSAYRSNQEVLRTQRHLLIAGNAASMGKLSAALSHELNSPLGVLKSSLATLRDLRAEPASVDPARRDKLSAAVVQLEGNADQALARMEDIVRRMQRFTNLDRAEEREFQVNRLVEDVVSLLDPEDSQGVDIELDLHQVPRILSKPQMVSAILSRQLQESVEAASPNGRVRVATRAEESGVHIDIQDSRPPIPPQDLAEIFEPRFQVSGGRVATGNWVWFNARQIIREHGGELSVISTGAGTTTTVTLPWRPSSGL